MKIDLAIFLALLLTTQTVAASAAATPATGVAAAPAPTVGVARRNDYANSKFMAELNAGLKHFYAREFGPAQKAFERALEVVSDNTLAISFLNAAAAHQPGALDVVTNLEEDAVSAAPKNYVNRVRLGFSYMFQSLTGRDRMQDARDEFNAAVALNPDGAPAHVGLGILRFNERSANRAKTEFLTVLNSDTNNVLAREYLGQLYQSDLRDPQRGLSYVIEVPNLVPAYADIAFHIGSLLHDLKQPDAALKYLATGVDLDTGHVGEAGQHGYTLMARIYIEQHKLEDAKKVLNTAITANADTIYARALLAKIKNGDYDTPKKQ